MTTQTPYTPLRRAREEQGMRLEDVASVAGVSLRAVFDAERGRHVPRGSTRRAIALALALRPNDLWPPEEAA